MTISTKLRSLCDIFNRKLLAINIFENYSDEPQVVFKQLLSTRLFFSLFFIGISVLVTYAAVNLRSLSETVNNPTFEIFEDLQLSHPETLKCPCSQISISYEAFFQGVPLFHQVCTSDFVSQLWIDHVFGTNVTFIWPFDLRTSFSSMWQIVAALCRVTRNSVRNALEQFSKTKLITSFVLSEVSLRARTQADFDVAYHAEVSDFSKSLTIVHRLAQANGYLTGVSTNFITAAGGSVLGTESVFLVDTKQFLPSTGEWCLCQRHGSCPKPGAFYLYDVWELTGSYNLREIVPNITIPGIIVDCLPLMTVFASTLECFYSQSCVNTILSMYPRITQISTLNISTASRFPINTPIKHMIDELFIEEIIRTVDFKSYYHACNPIQCAYTYQRRFEIVFIITTIAALVGGLNVALRLIAPHLLDVILFVQRLLHKQDQAEQNLKRLEKSQVGENKLSNTIPKILEHVKNLNLFSERYSQHPFYELLGRTATRFYIMSMSISLAVLAIYTSQSVQTITRTVLSPSREQYEMLFSQYSNVLLCPCTTISIPYGEFMSAIPKFHQLCNSDFIQPWWYQSFAYHWSLTSTIDFRFLSSSYFRTLAMFCEVAKLTYDGAYHRFSTTSYVNSQVLPPDMFVSQTNGFINTFQISTRLDFLYKLSLINDLLHGDQYASGMETNLAMITFGATEEALINRRPFQISPVAWSKTDQNGIICSCPIDSECIVDQRGSLFEIDGIQIACFMVDIALQSPLTCWYSQTCTDSLRIAFAPLGDFVPSNFTVLNSSLPSEFSTTITFKWIVDKLMIEYYNSSASFDTFYEICNPISCSYTYQERANIVYIITVLIGMFGGLNIILRLISYGFATIIYYRIPHEEQPISSIQVDRDILNNDLKNNRNTQTMNLCKNLYVRIVKANLFRSKSSDLTVVNQQRILTRMYLIMVFICCIIIIAYTVFTVETVTLTVQSPSLSKYQELIDKYSFKLQCPCKRIAIPYKEFMTVNINYHHVCSSDFVQQPWIRALFMNSYWLFYKRADIRIRGAAYFNLLSVLCKTIQANVDKMVNDFLENTFENYQSLTEPEFRSQMDTRKEQLKTTTARRIISSIDLYRNLTNANSYISSYFLNWYIWVPTSRPHATFPTNPVVTNGNCSCGTRSDCFESGGIYGVYTDELWYTIPGLFIGCSVLETVLRSTLECLYIQECIDTIKYYTYADNLPIAALDPSIASHFPITSTVGVLVENLFAEEWLFNVTYSIFYEQCAPMYCTYTVSARRNIIFIVTRLLGLYGGITVTLRVIIPFLFTTLLKMKSYLLRNRVVNFA